MPIQFHCYDCNAAATPPRCITCGNAQPVGIAPGETVGNYVITKLLGKGGMGGAYIATYTFGHDVVVKHMFDDPDPAIQTENLNRFQREARIQQAVSHPRFPAGYGYFTHSGLHFMAMEFVPGQDLEKELAARGGSLPEVEVLQIGIQLCEGLAFMHEMTDAAGNPDPHLHRDIKPGNTQLKPNGDIVILDFGIARPETQTAATVARVTAIGTEVYLPVEQFLGTPVKQSDQYLIAATMFHLLMGFALAAAPNFTARPAQIDQLPPHWLSVFRQALHDDYNLRLPSVRDFMAKLIMLLPAGVAPKLLPVAAPQPIPAPAGGGPMPIQPPPAPAPPRQPIWKMKVAKDPTRFLPSGNWRQPVTVMVFRDGQLFMNVVVIADINGVVKTANASPLGHFQLHDDSVTHPAPLNKQIIRVGVRDTATNTIVARDTITIQRPRDLGKKLRGVMGKLGAGIASPFTKGAKAVADHPIAAGVLALIIFMVIGFIFSIPWMWKIPLGLIALAAALAAIGGLAYLLYKLSARLSAPNLALALAAMLLLITLIAAYLQTKWPGGPFGFVWAISLPFCLFTAYCSWRLKALTARHASLTQAAAASIPPEPPPAWSPFARALRQAYLNPVTLLYYLGATGYILGALGK